MTSRFLREEAARFRGMAETADREATKLRFLAMAADYDVRAKIAEEMTDPSSTEHDTELPGPKLDEASKEAAEPGPVEAVTVKPGGRIARAPKETALVVRRPITRQR
ncbi:MAG: hypothetical protein ABSA58_06905 [Acetobacteraceae bacterium]|jgi:hypothetical protein